MLREALRYPIEGNDLGRKYLIGVLLTYGSLLVLPIFLLFGYYFRVMQSTLEGEDSLPKFEDYREMFVEGLKTSAVFLLYVMAPAVLGASLVDLIGSEFGGVSVLMLFAGFYLVPSALTRFAEDGQARASLRIREVAEKAFTRKYLKGWLSIIGALIVITVGQLAASIILIFSLIGIPALVVVWPAMRFYENIVYFRISAEMAE